MRYTSGKDWHGCTAKRVILFGMSGLGKTHISNMLRDTKAWYHYSVDYRIGTRYLGEAIDDNLKKVAMRDPFLRDQFLSDSIYIKSNITFNNLTPVSYFLGKPGAPELGGIPMVEFQRRQALFRAAEEAALMDTGHFIGRAQDLYGYPHFVCDTGGSICEWVDAEDPSDPILKALSKDALLVWIKGSEAHTEELIRRFDRAPKPMAYQPEFLAAIWDEYLAEKRVGEAEVNPDDFIRYTYARALAHRQPRYAAMAENWGVTVSAEDVAAAKTPEGFDALIGAALDFRASHA
ncbi:MAG: ATPase [Alphaproteobacteria bacterium]|nr:ATPase [Alphaproteobacteria bacterium]MBU1280925.1 ATPase [Alphaproteobacteria bacterium]MBU1574095.1 ATPase [Alphaproteobacteria bacterium]MBU1829359.1 ATPase [Alphaproteobacteria bacterium]MBU2079640.1 ATPase [Alphaproteobacteria bacterium]